MYLKGITLAVLFLQVINEAHSLKCYNCQGAVGSDCDLKPAEKDLKDCPPAGKDEEAVCVTLYKTINNTKIVDKFCVEKKWTCKKLTEEAQKAEGTTVDNCKLCETDGCNAPETPPGTPPPASSSSTTATSPPVSSSSTTATPPPASSSSTTATSPPASSSPTTATPPPAPSSSTTVTSPPVSSSTTTATEPPASSSTISKPEDKLKCYVCDGDSGNECETSPKKKDFEKVCSEIEETTKKPLRDALDSHSGVVPRASSEYQCVSYITSRGKQKKIVKRCVSKSTACDAISQEQKEMGWDASECKTCDTDLCNSSAAIQAGIYSLLLCFLATTLFARQ